MGGEGVRVRVRGCDDGKRFMSPQATLNAQRVWPWMAGFYLAWPWMAASWPWSRGMCKSARTPSLEVE